MKASCYKCLGIFFSVTSFLLMGGLVHAETQVQQGTLKVGLSADVTAIDPHFHNATNNSQINAHIFEPLMGSNPDISPRPLLAESFRIIDDVTWEFRLRKNVKFHDGSAFDANDVIFSFCRVPAVQNSPSPFTIYTKSIQDMVAKDSHTLVIKTKNPYPSLSRELAAIRIVSDGLINGEKVTYDPKGCKISGEWPKTEDFNSGKHAIGTGPFKYAEYVKGERIVLNRNEQYWGAKPQWRQVRFRPIASPGPRIAALLSGDVDFIENPPVQDILRLQKKGSNHKIASITSVRTLYIAMDQRADDNVPAGVKGTNGKNPFRDERVRQALSKAIDRTAIANGVMFTFAKPAEQLIAKDYFGADPLMPALPYDPDGAKKLLTEAGYPNGFEMTFSATNDRYVNDAQVAQAIAQMWTKIGVKTNVDTMPGSVFFGKRSKFGFGIFMAGWGPVTGEISSPLRALLATPNKEKGLGTANFGPYSDPALDQLIEKALGEVDDTKRVALLRQASKRATQTLGVIPVHYEITPWAMSNNLDYVPRGDQYTLAAEIKSANSRRTVKQ